jgi:hypothetical protein
VVLNAGVPVDITVPYTTADLQALKFCQSADTLYIFHPSYPPATLVRNSHTSWTYAVTQFATVPICRSTSRPPPSPPAVPAGRSP